MYLYVSFYTYKNRSNSDFLCFIVSSFETNEQNSISVVLSDSP